MGLTAFFLCQNRFPAALPICRLAKVHRVLRRTLPAAFANSKRTMSMTTRLRSGFGSLWPIFGHSGSIFGPGFRSLGSIFGPSDIRGSAPNVKKHYFLCHTAWSVVQMQQVPLYCTTNDEESHFLNPSDHTLLSSSSAELLQEITTSGIYLVSSGRIPFNCNQCNFSCTRKTLEESQFLTAHTHRASAVSLGLEITSGSACVCPTQLGR